jgi:hypothetical protein
MPLEEKIREILPELREASCRVEEWREELDDFLLQATNDTSFINPVDEMTDRLQALQPGVRDLLRQEVTTLTEGGATDFAECVSLCVHLDNADVRPPSAAKVPSAEGGAPILPWFAHYIGQLLAEVLPKVNSANVAEAGGMWVKLVAETFTQVVTTRFEQDCQTLGESVLDIATPLCAYPTARRADIVLALDKIADCLPDTHSTSRQVRSRALGSIGEPCTG